MKRPLPPGPININAAFGLTWRHYFQMRMWPVEFAEKQVRRFGDIVFFRIFQHPAVLINHPDHIREVLVTRSESFPKFERIMRHLKQATGEGLLVAEGIEWRRQRIAAQKIFRSARMQPLVELTWNHLQTLFPAWSKRLMIPVEHEMTLLFQSVMGQWFFGLDLRPGDAIADAVRHASDIFHHESRAVFNWPDWFPIKRKKVKRHSLQLIHRTIRSVVEERLRSQTRREDYLDILLNPGAGTESISGLGEGPVIEAIADQLLTMYVAGFHTTSVAAAWMLYAVANNDAIQARIRNELEPCRSDTDIMQLAQADGTYLDQVVRESLRMYPAAWELFARQAKCECELGGYRIPQGTLVLILPALTHRDPRFYPNPNAFDPERFAADRIQSLHPYAWIPFGAGPHTCIGKNVAMMQMRLVLAGVVGRYRLSLAGPGEKRIRVDRRVSARPRGDIRLRLEPLDRSNRDGRSGDSPLNQPAFA